MSGGIHEGGRQNFQDYGGNPKHGFELSEKLCTVPRAGRTIYSQNCVFE